MTTASTVSLHEELHVVDGLIISKWDRDLFVDMRKGGLTAANCTVSVWEGFQQTMGNIGDVHRLIRENSDLVKAVSTVEEIRSAKKEGRTGIILGFQNAHAFEDQVNYVEIFKRLGVGIVQLCYNTQNLIGTGCYERDGGLSGFGREIIAEMNRVGILCDLSHVGAVTSREIILESSMPVAYSHCLPYGLKAHPRNKTDEELRFIAEHGGFVGVTMFTPFLARGVNATVEDYAEAIEYIINIVGEDSVGIGTDFTQGQDQAFFERITHDKGYARKLTDFGEIINPKGIRTIGEFPNLTETLLKRGHSTERVKKIMGENWLRLLDKVWQGDGDSHQKSQPSVTSSSSNSHPI